MRETILQSHHFNNKIISVLNEKNELCHNMFEIGLQSLIGESVMIPYHQKYIGLKPRFVDIDDIKMQPDDYAKAAIDYLIQHAVSIKDTCTWLYDYEVYFRGNLVLQKNWPCSFGQAYILLGLIYWHNLTKDIKYLDLAIKAAKYYLLSIQEGGITNTINVQNETLVFFEEIPSEKPTHILNAHLVSVIALMELQRIFHADWLDEIVEKSLYTIKKILPLYDTGYWSKYDLADTFQSLFRIGINDTDTIFVKNIHFSWNNQSIIIDNSTGFDDNGTCYLSGIEWGCIETVDREKVRKLLNGNHIHKSPVVGGTIQNSYFNVCFNHIQSSLLNDENISVKIQVYTKEPASLYFEIQDYSKLYLDFHILNTQTLKNGWNTIEFTFPMSKLSYPLSDDYHDFHTDLLNVLSKKTENQVIVEKLKSFSQYRINRDFKQTYQPYIDDFSLDKKLDAAFISVNSVCGLNCIMCDIGIEDVDASLYKHLKSDTKYNMTIDDFETISSRLQDKVNTIAFIGTEALFNKNIPEIIAIAKQKFFYVTLTTNGINLYDYAEKIVHSGLDEIWLSIDGIGIEHDNIRKMEGLFEKFENGIKHLEDLKRLHNTDRPFINISSTILPGINETNLVNFVKYFETYDIKNFSLNHMNFVTEDIALKHNHAHPLLPITPSKYLNNFNFDNVNFIKFYDEINQVKLYAQQFGKSISLVPSLPTLQNLVDYYKNPEMKIGRKTCTAAWSTLEIDPKGNMSIAARCFQIDMGNIIHQSFQEIWDGPKYKNFRQQLINNESFLPCLRCCGSL